jgi:hypothetical protein
VLEYRDGDWAAVFPKPTQYSELIRDPEAYETYGGAHLETDRGERGAEFGVEHARWEYRPSLWVSDDGEAYLAHGRSVLKRSAPGQWEGIFEDDLAGGVLTALWGASGDEIFVGSSTGFISRYDGESWTREFSDEQLSITAIWTSGDDAWATGADRSSSMRFRAGACRRGGCRSDEEGGMVSVHRGLLLQRVGGAWRKVRLPDQLPTLSSVWASSPDDVYVGTIGRGLWHFDGNEWKRRAVRRSESDAKPLPSSLTDAKARELDFIHAIWGASESQLFVVASPMPHVSWVGITLLELDRDTSKTVKLNSYVEPGGLHGDPEHVLAAIGYYGVAQLRDDEWTRFRRIGEVVRVWAGAEYDYALSREGYFWFRRRPE